jgi:hypothetical protein
LIRVKSMYKFNGSIVIEIILAPVFNDKKQHLSKGYLFKQNKKF